MLRLTPRRRHACCRSLHERQRAERGYKDGARGAYAIWRRTLMLALFADALASARWRMADMLKKIGAGFNDASGSGHHARPDRSSHFHHRHFHID
jgi:hypothetical protein